MQDFTSLLTRGGGYLSPFTPYPDAEGRNDPEKAKKYGAQHFFQCYAPFAVMNRQPPGSTKTGGVSYKMCGLNYWNESGVDFLLMVV